MGYFPFTAAGGWVCPASSHPTGDKVTCVHLGTNLQGAVVSGHLCASAPLLAGSQFSGPARSPAGMAQHRLKGIGLVTSSWGGNIKA